MNVTCRKTIHHSWCMQMGGSALWLHGCAWHINRCITVKTAGSRLSGALFKSRHSRSLIREHLLNGKACKSYIIHQEDFKKWKRYFAADLLCVDSSMQHSWVFTGARAQTELKQGQSGFVTVIQEDRPGSVDTKPKLHAVTGLAGTLASVFIRGYNQYSHLVLSFEIWNGRLQGAYAYEPHIFISSWGCFSVFLSFLLILSFSSSLTLSVHPIVDPFIPPQIGKGTNPNIHIGMQ